MTHPSWHLSGDFYANCSCTTLQCPCAVSNFKAMPTRGWCTFAFALQVSKGQFGDLKLDGSVAIMVANCPTAMADGGWSMGLIFDDRMSPEQQQVLGGILGGEVGGPIVDYAPWVSNFLGTETRRIEFRKDGMNHSLYVEGMIDTAAEGLVGPDGKEPVVWDNVYHPFATRVAIAEADRIKIHAFGIDFEIAEGEKGFGAFCPFSWRVN